MYNNDLMIFSSFPIDEISLLAADFFYNIHRRFVEILHLTDMFADRGVMLVGDLLQIPPVCNQRHGTFSQLFYCTKNKTCITTLIFLHSCIHGTNKIGK